MPPVLRLPRQHFWLLCVVLFVAADSLGRVALVLMASGNGTAIFPNGMAVFPLGLINDTAIAMLLALPFLLGLHVLARFWRTRPGAVLAHLIFYALLMVPVLTQIAGVIFWNEFDSRFNSIAVNYLIFPREVLGVIRESFDTKVMIGIPLTAGVLYVALVGSFKRALAAPLEPSETKRIMPWAIGALVIAGAITWVGPLRVSANRELSELSASSAERFLAAALTNDQAYDGLYPGMDEAKAIALARAQVAQDNTQFLDAADVRSLRRSVTPSAPERKLNVVLVLEESFGSVYVNGTDNKGGEIISPNLDRLAAEGLFFTNIYATGNRTVNALEAIFTSFPPLPGISTARRAGSAGMNSLPAMLKTHGYNTAFLYGGRKAFDNMGTFWSGIGFENVWDQNDIKRTDFSTIWGVADEYLFDEAIVRGDELSAAAKPFFLSMLTVSNHRPYTYPTGRISRDPNEKYRYNAAAYADWAFGQFIENAKSKPWFKDTIFIFIGDHGPRVFGAAKVPVPSFRVPLLIYAPGVIAPERNDVVGSSMDVAPTLMGLLSITYDSPFFGLDLRRVAPEHGRVVMQHNFSIANGNGSDVAIIAPGNNVYGYTMTPGPFELTPSDAPKADLLDRVIATTQTAHRMFYARQYHQRP